MRQWSEQQNEIFQWFESAGVGNALVRARAGTGKTTVIVEGVRRAPEERALVAAFNKKIAEELQHRIGINSSHIEARTLHSIGFGFVRYNVDGVRIDSNRGDELALQACLRDYFDPPKDAVKLVAKLAALGKAIDFDPSLETMVRIAAMHDKEPEEVLEKQGFTTEVVARLAINAMKLALVIDETNPVIDFDDMLYLPVAKNWARPRYPLVVVDEAQDMNRTQLELARRISRGRICVVGDDRQAIYGFRGASSGALDTLKRELGAKEYPLNTTYRCGRAIVDYARKLVPDFQAGPTNPEGQILSMSKVAALEAVQHGDFLLSRKNAPLVSLCLALLRSGKTAHIEGRDIGATLVSIVKRRNASSVSDLQDKMKEWMTRETDKARRLLGDKATTKIENIADQFETVIALTEDCSSVDRVLQRIESMFADLSKGAGGRVLLSSIHRSKGLEADRVFVCRETLYAGGRTDDIEEKNLDYVAATRAKTTLVWVTGVK